MAEAKKRWRRISDFAKTLRSWSDGTLYIHGYTDSQLLDMLHSFKNKYIAKLADDMDTAGALAETETFVSEMNRLLLTDNERKIHDDDDDYCTHGKAVQLCFLTEFQNLLVCLGLPQQLDDKNIDHRFGNKKNSLMIKHDQSIINALNAAVEFRSNVRRCTLEEKEFGPLKAKILGNCDQFRDKFSSQGFELKVNVSILLLLEFLLPWLELFLCEFQDTRTGKSIWQQKPE